ncbi:GntR family transcriptional regulator [Rhodococcus jostii]|uniref:GntR family transcriptional regulator n=1 Tax=Rhodococcus jostii TaxID=132919 RepID=UPI00362AED9B
MADRVKTTRTEVVYDEVRAEILNGEVSPGVRLKIADLGARFGVSLSVVREALTRLGEQGLVVANPQRGFNVVDVSPEDLKDITHVRIQIETMALKDSIEHGGLAWESLVVSTHHTLERTPVHLPDGRINCQWLQVHRDFHQALLAGCGSPRLQSIANSLRDGAELYRVWSDTLAHDRRDLAGEHRAIMEAALAGDVESAQRLLTEHISRTTEALLGCSQLGVPSE